MRACWNCGTAQDDAQPYCGGCGRTAAPGPEMLGAVDYLVTEVERWDWLNPWRRGEITSDYRARRTRLERVLAGETLAVAAPTATLERTPEPAPAFGRPRAAAGQPVVSETPRVEPAEPPEWSTPSVHASAGDPVPPGVDGRPATWFVPPAPELPAQPDLMTRISGFLEERNIRWIHTLGALLLLAAGIGFLRSQWSVVGRLVVTLSLLLAPLGAFAAAFRLRERLPISSRLLAVLGGLLMPTGLLALRVFGYVHAPAEPWNGLCYLACTAVLAWLCVTLDEPACVWLGAASAALSAHFFGAAAHAPQVFGATVFPLAFGLMGASRVRLVRPSLEGHVRGAAHLLALLAMLVTESAAGVLALPQAATHPYATTVVLAAAGSLFYVLSAATYRSPLHLYASCACAVYGALAASHGLHAPVGWVLLGAALALAVGALAIEKRLPRGWALPLAHCAALVAVGALGREASLWLDDQPDHLASSLLAVSLTCAAMARAWRGWPFLDRTVEDALAATAAFLLPASLLLLAPPQARLPMVALQLVAVHALSRGTTPWHVATRVALLGWMPLLLACPLHPDPSLAVLELAVPAAAYGALALTDGAPAVGAASFLLLLPLLVGDAALETRALVLAAFAGLYVALRRLDTRFAVPAWVAGVGGWHAALLALHVPHETQVYAWWPVSVGLGALWIATRDRTVGGLTVLTVLGLAGFALDVSPLTALPLTLGVHALLAAVAALRVERLDGRSAALEAAQLAAALGALLLAQAPWFFATDLFVRAAATLAAVGLAAAVLEPRFRDWPGGPWPAGAWLSHLAAFCVPAVALTLGREAGLADGLAAAQLAVAAGLLAAGLAARQPHHARAAHDAAMAATVLGAVLPSHVVGLHVVPAALWAVASISGRATRNMVELAAALALANAVLWSAVGPAMEAVGGFAAALAISAVRRDAESDAAAALVLLPASLALLGQREVLPWETVACGTAGLGLLTTLAALGRRSVFTRPLQLLSPVFAVAGAALGLGLATPGPNTAALAVLLGAGALGVTWRTREGHAWASHAAYALLHLLLLRNVPEPRVLEWYLVPLGAWLLFVASLEANGRLETVGCLLIGLPWVWTSLIDPSPLQAVSAGVVGVALFLLGQGRRRLLPAVVGTIVVVAEVALETHRFLASMPWQVYTTVAGLMLIAMGVLFERQRQRLMLLGERILAQWK